MARIKNLIILSFCLLLLPARKFERFFDKIGHSTDKKNFLFIHNSKLGDMVCATPLFRAVKYSIPTSLVSVIGNSVNRELLDGNKDVDNYIVSPKGFFDLVKVIRKNKYDFGSVLTPDFYGLSALFLAGVKDIVAPVIVGGWSPYETKPYKILRKFVETKKHQFGGYAPREYLRLVEPIGVYSDKTIKFLRYSKNAESAAKSLLPKEYSLLVGISPGAGNQIKRWEPKRFAEVANHLIENYGSNIVLIGGRGDIEDSEVIISHVVHKDMIVNTVGKTNIDTLKALISMLDLFISVDTGPIYIAEAFSIPTVDIVGPMDINEQPPIGELHKIVYDFNRKAPELHIMNARVYDKKEALRQVDAISSAMVIDECDKLIPFLQKKVNLHNL